MTCVDFFRLNFLFILVPIENITWFYIAMSVFRQCFETCDPLTVKKNTIEPCHQWHILNTLFDHQLILFQKYYYFLLTHGLIWRFTPFPYPRSKFLLVSLRRLPPPFMRNAIFESYLFVKCFICNLSFGVWFDVKIAFQFCKMKQKQNLCVKIQLTKNFFFNNENRRNNK